MATKESMQVRAEQAEAEALAYAAHVQRALPVGATLNWEALAGIALGELVASSKVALAGVHYADDPTSWPPSVRAHAVRHLKGFGPRWLLRNCERPLRITLEFGGRAAGGAHFTGVLSVTPKLDGVPEFGQYRVWVVTEATWTWNTFAKAM